MSDDLDMKDLTAKLTRLKQQRERLLTRRAEKMATLKSSQEELKRLKEEAKELGYNLTDIPDLLAEKKRELNAQASLLEEALDEVEERLNKYEV
jgi:chromosome segregation ATPase